MGSSLVLLFTLSCDLLLHLLPPFHSRPPLIHLHLLLHLHLPLLHPHPHLHHLHHLHLHHHPLHPIHLLLHPLPLPHLLFLPLFFLFLLLPFPLLLLPLPLLLLHPLLPPPSILLVLLPFPFPFLHHLSLLSPLHPLLSLHFLLLHLLLLSLHLPFLLLQFLLSPSLSPPLHPTFQLHLLLHPLSPSSFPPLSTSLSIHPPSQPPPSAHSSVASSSLPHHCAFPLRTARGKGKVKLMLRVSDGCSDVRTPFSSSTVPQVHTSPVPMVAPTPLPPCVLNREDTPPIYSSSEYEGSSDMEDRIQRQVDHDEARVADLLRPSGFYFTPRLPGVHSVGGRLRLSDYFDTAPEDDDIPW